MELPQILRAALESRAAAEQPQRLADEYAALSEGYRTRAGTGKRHVTTPSQALAYAVARMPATYGAAFAALSNAISGAGISRPVTLLDVGAGTGAACWAAGQMLDLISVTCVERERAMLDLGCALMRGGPESLQRARWQLADASDAALPPSDIVIVSYMLGESPPRLRESMLRRMWQAAGMLLLVIEPGTPQGFSSLVDAKRQMRAEGAYVAAPCPAESECPMSDGDWCHFTCRMPRGRLHKAIKGGEAPYEDEKYSYMAFTRRESASNGVRILRHPVIAPGHIRIEACDGEGIRNITLSKKDGEKYKLARKLGAGDLLPP